MINLTSRHESVSLPEVQYMLQSQELHIEQQNVAMNLESHSANVAFKKGGQNWGNSNGGYHGGNHQSQQSNRGGKGHGKGGRGHFRHV